MTRPKKRARELGIPFEGIPGARNAIVDVAPVAVGHATVIAEPNVHTGVTAIWPRGARDASPVFGGYAPLNGNGELTGAGWIDESGMIEGPIMLTNTYSVGTVRDGVLRYLRAHWKTLGLANQHEDYGALPVVAETWDGELNDIFGFHVTTEHVHDALANARDASAPEPIAEGNVGGGTGMTLFDFKGGTGTASRLVTWQLPKQARVKPKARQYTVGVLAQCNFGTQCDLLVAGVPIGAYFDPPRVSKTTPRRRHKGSVIVVIATDAPLPPHVLRRLARRAGLGIARVGAISEDTSGDLFLAFSTAEREQVETVVETEILNALFEGVVLATEEAVVNALVAAETMQGPKRGRRRETYEAIDLARLRRYLRKHARLVD